LVFFFYQHCKGKAITDGFCGFSLEMNFAVNVAGVYALTELLMPALKRASPGACVISVASGGMYTENLTENLQVFFAPFCKTSLIESIVASKFHILKSDNILDSSL